MSRVGHRIHLKKLLANVDLPALPQSAIRLVELAGDPKNGPSELAVPIESDAGLTGQLLKFVNSSHFGFAQEIPSVRLAVVLLGIRTVKNFALWNAVFSMLPNPKCGPFDLKLLWQDSLRRALFARAVATNGEAEDVFVAALLQDMAIPLLAQELPEQYGEFLDARESGRKRLSDIEAEEFGWTHADAAAVMARVWKFPKQLTELIESHTRIHEVFDSSNATDSMFSVVLSALLPTSCDADWSERKQFQSGYIQLRDSGAPELSELFTQVDKQFENLAPILKLAIPSKSLVSSLNEQDVAV